MQQLTERPAAPLTEQEIVIPLREQVLVVTNGAGEVVPTQAQPTETEGTARE